MIRKTVCFALFVCLFASSAQSRALAYDEGELPVVGDIAPPKAYDAAEGAPNPEAEPDFTESFEFMASEEAVANCTDSFTGQLGDKQNASTSLHTVYVDAGSGEISAELTWSGGEDTKLSLTITDSLGTDVASALSGVPLVANGAVKAPGEYLITIHAGPASRAVYYNLDVTYPAAYMTIEPEESPKGALKQKHAPQYVVVIGTTFLLLAGASWFIYRKRHDRGKQLK